MEVFFNECSLHGQFNDIQQFSDALDVLMGMRSAVNKYNRELYCHRNCSSASVAHGLSLQQAVQQIDRSKARVLMSWFCRAGPFWEDIRRHSEDDYFECRGEIVTDTAVGECAYWMFDSRPAQLASITPSDWSVSPVDIDWHKEDESVCSKSLINHFSVTTLEEELEKAAPPPESWDQLAEMCLVRFGNLEFSGETFRPLRGKPFVLSAAKGFIDLLDILSRFKAEHLLEGGRTKEGQELYQKFFTGDMGWFSDSSDGEKSRFSRQMTFADPCAPSETIFAPFHGKVQTPPMRVHFSWPITSDTPLKVLYIGDKITKC